MTVECKMEKKIKARFSVVNSMTTLLSENDLFMTP
jgi:hypothetical protein